MRVRFYHILWDTTDEEHPEGQNVNLPKEVIADDFDGDPVEEGADYLSNLFDFCIYRMSFEMLDRSSDDY